MLDFYFPTKEYGVVYLNGYCPVLGKTFNQEKLTYTNGAETYYIKLSDEKGYRLTFGEQYDATRLRVTRHNEFTDDENTQLIKDYFNEFPNIKAMYPDYGKNEESTKAVQELIFRDPTFWSMDFAEELRELQHYINSNSKNIPTVFGMGQGCLNNFVCPYFLVENVEVLYSENQLTSHFGSLDNFWVVKDNLVDRTNQRLEHYCDAEHILCTSLDNFLLSNFGLDNNGELVWIDVGTLQITLLETTTWNIEDAFNSGIPCSNK